MYSALRIDCCFCGSSVVFYSPSGFRNKFHLTPAAGIPTPVSTASRARIVKHVKILCIFLADVCQKNAHGRGYGLWQSAYFKTTNCMSCQSSTSYRSSLVFRHGRNTNCESEILVSLLKCISCSSN